MYASRALRMPILKRSSYYESDYRQSAALIRARRPYLVKNAVTGVVIMSFALGVFAFTLKAVGQDTFEDVVVPRCHKSASKDTKRASKRQMTKCL